MPSPVKYIALGAALTSAVGAGVYLKNKEPERKYSVTYELPAWPPCHPCDTRYVSKVVKADELEALLRKNGEWVHNLEVHPY